MSLYSVHYNEIFLKGGNRSRFEDALIANVKAALHGKKPRMEKAEKTLILECEGGESEVKKALARVFGIEWFALVFESRKDRKGIENLVLEKLGEMDLTGKTIRVKTKRADKKLPFTSMELSRDIGAAIVDKFGCRVDLHKPDITIYIEIMQKDRAFVHFEKHRGPGGLPVGVSGKVVALLSGGIDSPVAAWMMMKRGAEVVFLHVHPLTTEEEAEKSKIRELAAGLAGWEGGAKLCVADYSEFYKKTLGIPPKYELVMFRKFIYLLAQEVAKKEGALAIVSGDSLGQVASQTLQNIYAVNRGLEMPVFRPLVGMNKDEIIEHAKRIGTYDISIKPYKDCCSLVAVRNPETRADADFVQKIAGQIGLDEIVRKTAEKVRVIEV